MVCELGEGVSGNVTKCRLKNRALAVKVSFAISSICNFNVEFQRMKRTDNHEESKVVYFESCFSYYIWKFQRIFMDLEVIRKCNDCDYIVKCYGYIITFVSPLKMFYL